MPLAFCPPLLQPFPIAIGSQVVVPYLPACRLVDVRDLHSSTQLKLPSVRQPLSGLIFALDGVMRWRLSLGVGK